MPSDKLEDADEPPAKLPAQLRDVSCPDRPNHAHHHAVGHAHAVDYGAGHCLKRLVNPCVCYNSGLGEGSNESSLDCKNMPPDILMLFEEALYTSMFQPPLENRLQLGEPPIMSPQRSYYPKG